MSVPGSPCAGAPVRARVVTYGLVGLLAFCVLAQVEGWPLSSFRLFSQARTSATTSWDVRLVDGAGAEHDLPFDRLPRGYRGVHQLAPQLATMPPGDRDAVCRAWADAAASRLGVVVAEVRVYRVAGHVAAGDDPAPAPRRTLSVTCAGAGP
ncbi:MAG: hypothetical protein ACR2MO_06240 [Acidimicrobiales bacterium]